MKYAILIVNPVSVKQTKRLVERLNNNCFDFYIHIDKSQDAKPYRNLQTVAKVFLVKPRLTIKQGGYSTTQATINGINQIIRSGIAYQAVSLIGGGDYPIKRADEIYEFLNLHKDMQFMAHDETWIAQTIDEKINQYHLLDHRIGSSKLAGKLFNYFAGKPHVPENLKFAGRSAYWTMTLPCAKYVLDYIESFELDTFFRYTKGSDQFLFQSIILDSPYRETVVNNNYRYINCHEDDLQTGLLTTRDFNKIIFSDCLFAGNFDIEIDEDVLDMIDRANHIKISYL